MAAGRRGDRHYFLPGTGEIYYRHVYMEKLRGKNTYRARAKNKKKIHRSGNLEFNTGASNNVPNLARLPAQFRKKPLSSIGRVLDPFLHFGTRKFCVFWFAGKPKHWGDGDNRLISGAGAQDPTASSRAGSSTTRDSGPGKQVERMGGL